MRRYLSLLLPLALILSACVSPAQEVHQTGARIHHALARFHHLGLHLSHRKPGLTATGRQLAAAPYPAAVDLSQWAPPVGDQGAVGSCVTWALSEFRYWLLAHDQGIHLAGSLAPMFLYSRSSHGQDNGSTYQDNLQILSTEGIPPDAQYGPKPHDADGPHAGRYDYLDPPSQADTFAATAYRITGYHELFQGPGTPGAAEAIKAALAEGHPVGIAIPVWASFMFAGSKYPVLVDQPASGEQFFGYHAIFAPRYDAKGLWIENSWGTDWSQNGWAELSWSFVSTRVEEAWVMDGPQPQPTATPTPTETPLPTATTAPTLTPTAVASPTEALTPTAQATVTATVNPVPVPPVAPTATTAAIQPTPKPQKKCAQWVRTNVQGVLWCRRYRSVGGTSP